MGNDAGLLGRLHLGDHACVLVEDDETRLHGIAAYVEAGLRAGDRILYFGPDPGRLAGDLTGVGVDARGAAARGGLRMATPEESYLAAGAFDPAATMAGWRTETTRARADGFRGLRAIGDMSWAVRPVPGAGLLADYQAQVNRVFADGGAMAICLYDRRVFPDTALQRVRWAHPATVDRAGWADAEPALRVIRTTTPPGIRLIGVADLANRHALRAVMEHLAEDTPAGGPVTVDISGLRSADVAAMRILMRAALDGPRPLRVTGGTPATRRLLAFNGVAVVDA